jgi:hypothetical protein
MILLFFRNTILSLETDPNIKAYVGATYINVTGMSPDPFAFNNIGAVCQGPQYRTCLINMGADSDTQMAAVRFIFGIFITFSLRYRETERQRGRETERQRDRETERQRDRETERQRDRPQ